MGLVKIMQELKQSNGGQRKGSRGTSGEFQERNGRMKNEAL